MSERILLAASLKQYIKLCLTKMKYYASIIMNKKISYRSASKRFIRKPRTDIKNRNTRKMHHSLPHLQEKLGKIVKSYLDLA